MNQNNDQNLPVDRFIIEPMQPADLDQVVAIEESSYRKPWSKAGFEAELNRPQAVCRVIREADQVLGYIVFWMVRGEVHLLNLALKPDRRQQGLGRLLMDYMIHWGKEQGGRKIFLEVRVSNQAARRLYEKTGFVMTGRRKNYYSEEKEDALLMARSI